MKNHANNTSPLYYTIVQGWLSRSASNIIIPNVHICVDSYIPYQDRAEMIQVLSYEGTAGKYSNSTSIGSPDADNTLGNITS